MSTTKIQKLKSIFRSNGGCGCRSKPADIIEPKPKSKTSSTDQKSSHYPSHSASSSDKHGGGNSMTADDVDNDCSSTAFSLNIDASPNRCPKIQDSFAIVKNSDDPYHDFRNSMLQMILEKEIYSQNDLQQLLDCFLQLNSPQHHQVIVKAFIEIWNGGGSSAGDGGETTPCEN